MSLMTPSSVEAAVGSGAETVQLGGSIMRELDDYDTCGLRF